MWALQVALVVKNPPASAGGIRDTSSIPGSWRSLEVGTTTHSTILAWRIPWTEEPGGLQSMGSQRVRHDWGGLARVHTHKSNTHVWRCPAPTMFPLRGVELPSVHLVAEAKTLGPSWTPHFPHCLQIQPVIRPFNSTSEANFHVPPMPVHLHWARPHKTNAGPSYQGPKWLLCLLQHFSLSWSHPIGLRKYFNSLEVQFLGLGAFTAEAMGSVPG